MTRDRHDHTRSVRKRATGIAALALAVPLVAGVSAPAHAATETRYVSTAGHDINSGFTNNCSVSVLPCLTIAHAIAQANAGDTISIASGSYAESITITKSLTLVGTGSTLPKITGDGGNDVNVLIDGESAPAPIAVSLRDIIESGSLHSEGIQAQVATVELTDTQANDNNEAGVYVVGGATVTATGSTFNGNGFGFYDSGALTLTDSTVSGNSEDGVTVPGESAKITRSTISGNGGFGVSLDGGPVTISHSTISANDKGGVDVAGSDMITSTVHITTSTLSGNTVAGVEADPHGAAIISKSTVSGTHAAARSIQPYGGGLLAEGGSVQASEVTLDGNTNFGVGVDANSGASQATITNSTITATKKGSFTSPLLGGLATDGAGASLSVSGTIDATNLIPDCGGAITDQGYNLASDTTCALHAKGSRQHVTAKLGKLVNNGGPTKTVLPGVTSPARNAIPFGKAGCVKGATDQRGKPRRSPAAGRCDIGSVEATVVNPKLHAKIVGHKTGGRYHGAVTVKFHCTTGSARLTHKCPKPTHLKSSGHHHVTKSIHAVDGGIATVKLTVTIA
jgi:Right handed beta helix region